MKYNFFSLFEAIKKQYFLLFIVYLFLYFMILLYMVMLPMDISSFTKLVGIHPYFDGVKILWMLFQISCHVYITYTFFTNDKDHSLEFLLLRESNKKNFLNKFVVICIFTIIIRSFIFLATYFCFFRDLDFSIPLFFINIMLYLAISIVTSLFALLQAK
ncbi:MAG: hypothetical protein PUE33_01580 [bacterium]|nr:hypothetical protein [bacterium]